MVHRCNSTVQCYCDSPVHALSAWRISAAAVLGGCRFGQPIKVNWAFQGGQKEDSACENLSLSP